jgi:signal transduction histidine kinase
MPFKVHARTIFHLGADLISSDSIALYELVKNAFDAGSPDVEIKWVVRIPSVQYFDLRRRLMDATQQTFKKSDLEATIRAWKRELTEALDKSAPEVPELSSAFGVAETLDQVLSALDEANYIDVIDTGSGMSFSELQDIYLSIGTPHRLRQKFDEKQPRQILGDKGVGRLAAMRLGRRILVRSATLADAHWNLLHVNWDAFLEDLDASLEDIPVAPEVGEKKLPKTQHGTRLHVSALSSSWTLARARELANEDIAKLGDPFAKTRFPVVLSFNDEAIKIPRFESVLTDYAHAAVELKFVAQGAASRVEGTIDYLHRKRRHAFVVKGTHLLSVAGLDSFATLDSLGSFDARFYWFNRQMLRKLEGSAELKHVISLQERWAGGLMIYRDGFRVNPYGTGDDDWLNLDRVALASPGYKVNRRQIVGKVSISSKSNPALVDQTNREGIRDSQERGVLVHLLRHSILNEFKPFLERCDQDAKEGVALTVAEIEERVTKERKRLRGMVSKFREDYPKVAKDSGLATALDEAIEKLEALMGQARRQVESYEEAQDRVLHLAATGLLVEMLAHELNRATRQALTILNERSGAAIPHEMTAMLKTLEAQLKTLQKRLRILDPLATAGRQVKETFDLVDWVREIVESHKEQFKRHKIDVEFVVRPPKAKGCSVKMVKGMLVQILENVFSNSIYWLGQQAKLERGFRAEVVVEIDTKSVSVSVTDNGPGIDPDRRESIFEPFVTTKPAGEGKGLGLFISREVAKYHKASFDLADAADDDGQYRTFILNLGNVSA